MSELIDALDAEQIELKTFLALLGFRNQQHNLHGLHPTCDDEQAVELIGKLCNSYLRFPPHRSIAELINDFVLLQRLDALEESFKNDDSKALHLATRAFEKAAQQIQIPGRKAEWTQEMAYEAAITYAQNLRKEIREAHEWQAQHEEAQKSGRVLMTQQHLKNALAPEEAEKIDTNVRLALVREHREEIGHCTACGKKLSKRCRGCLDTAAERQRGYKAQQAVKEPKKPRLCKNGCGRPAEKMKHRCKQCIETPKRGRPCKDACGRPAAKAKHRCNQCITAKRERLRTLDAPIPSK